MRGKFCLAALLLAALLLAVLVPAALAAQAPSFFVLHQEMAKPSMLKQYEEVNKELIATVQKHHAHSPAFSFTTVAGDDYVYTYVTPIRSFTDLESIYNGFAALAKARGRGQVGRPDAARRRRHAGYGPTCRSRRLRRTRRSDLGSLEVPIRTALKGPKLE